MQKCNSDQENDTETSIKNKNLPLIIMVSDEKQMV